MKTLNLDLIKLAKEVVNRFPFNIHNEGIKINDHYEEDYFMFIEEHIQGELLDNEIVPIAEERRLLDELHLFIVQEIRNRADTILNDNTEEDWLILDIPDRQYDIEEED